MEERDYRIGLLDLLLWGMITAAVGAYAYHRGDQDGLKRAPEYVRYQAEFDEMLERVLDKPCDYSDLDDY